MCGAPLHHIPPRSYRRGVWAKPCAGRTSSSSPRRRADGTHPRHFAGSKSGDRHRAERVMNSEVPYVRYLDRSDREDVRLHQPRCHNASSYGLRGYVDNTLPSHCYAITMILRVRRIFFEITTFPNTNICKQCKHNNNLSKQNSM